MTSKISSQESIAGWLSRFAAAAIGGAAFFGSAVALFVELRAQRIIIEPINVSLVEKNKEYVPQNLNLRIVEQIERIRDETKSKVSSEHQAVTRVDDISFKTEGIEFSAFKFLAPIKAAIGRSDTRVVGELTCYRFGCELEPEEEELRFSNQKPSASGTNASEKKTNAPEKNTLRLRLALIIQGPAGVETFQTRLSLNKWKFTREIDQETLKSAEAIMEWTDPVTAASFFYLRSTEFETAKNSYQVERYRKRAVTAAKLAHQRRRVDSCWMNNLLATIALDEKDLNGANFRVDAEPGATRKADPSCDADLHLTRGLIRLGELDWEARRKDIDPPENVLLEAAKAEFRLAAGNVQASPDTRAAAVTQSARVLERLQPSDPARALEELEKAADRSDSASLSANRPDFSMQFLVEAGRIAFKHGRIDAALTRFWEAVRSYPGAVEPYVEITRALMERARSPNAEQIHRERDLALADAALHEALNGSPDDRAVEIRLLLSDLQVAKGEISKAIKGLSNVSYELDRTHHPPRSTVFEKRAYSRWLFLLRRESAVDSAICEKRGIGLAQLREDASSIFWDDAQTAKCLGDLGERWELVRKYENECSTLEKLELARCMACVDDSKTSSKGGSIDFRCSHAVR